jgi:restriction system protein
MNPAPDDPGRPRRRLRPSGGYRELRSFQTSTLIYDGTWSFCERFIDRRSRTHDQMVQAARSGRQNIAEGNRAGAVSSKSELELTNWARASQEELLLDFQDYLRHRKLPLWPKESAEASAVRALGRKIGARKDLTDRSDASDRTDRTDRTDLSDPEDAGDRARYALYAPWLEHESATVVANTLICLIHQANYLLDQQLTALEQDFIEGGGYSEQLAAARLAYRRGDRSDRTDLSQKTDRDFPKCPQCGKLMTLRTARQGKNQGSQFWGCTGYPDCKGAVPLDASAP